MTDPDDHQEIAKIAQPRACNCLFQELILNIQDQDFCESFWHISLSVHD